MIGQVILDKSTCIRTVVNKIGQIETEYRTFPMEVIAGEHDFKVTLKESNARFTFDFRHVYWNSRLQAEHARLVDIIERGLGNEKESSTSDSCNNFNGKKGGVIVADIMAGVGPFAVPLAMSTKGVLKVYANGN